jgi:hypothetical protein
MWFSRFHMVSLHPAPCRDNEPATPPAASEHRSRPCSHIEIDRRGGLALFICAMNNAVPPNEPVEQKCRLP